MTRQKKEHERVRAHATCQSTCLNNIIHQIVTSGRLSQIHAGQKCQNMSDDVPQHMLDDLSEDLQHEWSDFISGCHTENMEVAMSMQSCRYIWHCRGWKARRQQ